MQALKADEASQETVTGGQAPLRLLKGDETSGGSWQISAFGSNIAPVRLPEQHCSLQLSAFCNASTLSTEA